VAVNSWLRKQLERAGWVIAADGSSTKGAHQLFSPDNTYDIGADNATRPRDLHISGVMEMANSLRMSVPADGVLLLRNGALTDFSRLQFGGTTSPFPALVRSTTDLQVARADGTIAKTLGGVLTVNTTQTATAANTTETDLWTYSLPANALSADGKGVRITVFGTTAATANTKNIRLYFGSTVLESGGALALNGNAWRVVAEVYRTGASAQLASALATVSINDGSTGTARTRLTTPAETLSGAITIKVTGQNGTAAANDIVFRGAIVEALN
jgi:hypothetical protein